MPALSELDRPEAKSGLCATFDVETIQRLADPRGLMACHDDGACSLEASARSTVWRISGLPEKWAISLFGPPIRLERPAASTTTCTVWLIGGDGISRGCGRVGISISSPPTPMPAISRAGHIEPGDQPVEHPVEAVFLGAARATGRADDRLAAELSQHQQVAGVDGHAGTENRPAGLPDGCGDDVVEIAQAPKRRRR